MKRIITPEQQLENWREAIWQREYALEHRGIPAREILALVRDELRCVAFAERVARGEIQTAEIHECDAECEQPCPDWED